MIAGTIVNWMINGACTAFDMRRTSELWTPSGFGTNSITLQTTANNEFKNIAIPLTEVNVTQANYYNTEVEIASIDSAVKIVGGILDYCSAHVNCTAVLQDGSTVPCPAMIIFRNRKMYIYCQLNLSIKHITLLRNIVNIPTRYC